MARALVIFDAKVGAWTSYYRKEIWFDKDSRSLRRLEKRYHILASIIIFCKSILIIL